MNTPQSLLACLVLQAVCFTAAAETTPAPELAPGRVVAIQLEALQSNDDRDTGIEQTWAFAHPRNRIQTGPLERFAAMIRSPGYRALLGHKNHTIRPVVVTGRTALFAVTVIPESGPVAFYQWKLEKVSGGEFAGSWMTIAVSQAAGRGDAI